MASEPPLYPEEMALPMDAKLGLLMLGGRYPGGSSAYRRTKAGQLERLGWRILPIPRFWSTRELWHDPKSPAGNTEHVDFMHAKEWLIIPPEDSDLRAFKVNGRTTAIRTAWALAMPDTAQPAE